MTSVFALFARRPESIKRLFFDEATGKQCGEMCRWLATAKKIYRQVRPEELEKVGGTVHHGGIVAIAEAPELIAPTQEQVTAWAAEGLTILVLDRIGNAHNLGAIARTAAYFGVRHIVIPDHPQQAIPGEASYRVAEGGLEHLTVWCVKDFVDFCRFLRRDFAVVGAALSGQPLASFSRGSLNGAASAAKPTALVLGNEEEGLARDIAFACTRLVRIPGTGAVQSLNVSAAAAILIAAASSRG